MNYEELIADTFADPIGAFRAALEASDPTAVALVSVLGSTADASTTVARFEAFVSHFGPTPVTTDLVLGILERRESLPEELIDAAYDQARHRDPSLPINANEAKRIHDLVRNPEVEAGRRSRLLLWLHLEDPSAARDTAKVLLADPNESFSIAAHQAILIMGLHDDQEARSLLEAYAERQFQNVAPEPGKPPPHPEAALIVAGAIANPTDADLPLIGRLVTGAAERQLGIGEHLKRLFPRLTMEQIGDLVGHLQRQGHITWLAEQFVPALIAVRAADMASIADAEWWPTDCLPVFAQTRWEQYDDRLYPKVLTGLHRTGDETSCQLIREGVRDRCQQTNSPEAGEMPRIGARALLNLSLREMIPTTDPDLLAALAALGDEPLADEIIAARWKLPRRARRLGHIVAQVDASLLPSLVELALDRGSDTAIGVIDGATAPLMDPHVDGILNVVGHDQAVLAGLCEISDTAAQRTLQRWESEHDMISFRALESTSYADNRLSTIPTVVRPYGELSPAERAELLDACGPTEERVELLCGILEDRSNPPGNRPSTADCTNALDRLGEHLTMGHGTVRAAEVIGGVCNEVPALAIRKCAYAALGHAIPTPEVVDLLLERKEHETPKAVPDVDAALGQIAHRLDQQARDLHGRQRADTVRQLARIDNRRALEHARTLLDEQDPGVRMVAAEIIGATGGQEDADRLEAVAADEPNLNVRRELMRSLGRLRIGDAAQAHERIGELAGIEDVEAWLALDPTKAYGPWVDPLLKGLDRVARAESTGDIGTAIDKLDEIAKALLFRAMEVAGDQVGVSKEDRAKAATNALDYGSVLVRQQLNQKWTWVHYFGSLHGLRTAHIAARGTVSVPPERTPEDLSTAYSFLKLGARECCQILLATLASPEGTQHLRS